jgi:hypothetical protein
MILEYMLNDCILNKYKFLSFSILQNPPKTTSYQIRWPPFRKFKPRQAVYLEHNFFVSDVSNQAVFKNIKNDKNQKLVIG